MKKNFVLIFIMVVLLTGCSKSSAIEEILATVPNEAGIVLTANVKQLMKDGILTSSPQSSNMDNSEIFEKFGGDNGLDMTAVIFFSVAGQQWLTARVKDKSATEVWLAKSGQKNSSYLTEHQLWVLTGHGDARSAKRFETLTEKESFAGNEYAAGLIESDKSINFYVDIDKSMDASGIGMEEMLKMRMMLATAFTDARFVAGFADITKDKFESEIILYDGNGKPARTALKTSRISRKVAGAVEGDYNIMFGISLSEEAVDRLQKQFGHLLSNTGLPDMLSSLKGTIVMGFNIPDSPFLIENNWSVAIEAKDSADASKLVNDIGEVLAGGAGVRVKDDVVVITNGALQGNSPRKPSEEVVGLMSGNALAMVTVVEPMAGIIATRGGVWQELYRSFAKNLKYIVYTLPGEDDKVEIKIKGIKN